MNNLPPNVSELCSFFPFTDLVATVGGVANDPNLGRGGERRKGRREGCIIATNNIKSRKLYRKLSSLGGYTKMYSNSKCSYILITF